MRRSFPFLIVVLSAAVVLSACGGGAAGGAAAKVNSTTISQTEFTDQLAVLADNTKWLTALAPQFGDAPLTAANGNVSSTFAAAWLTALMNQAIVDQAFAKKDLEVTEANKKAALTAAKSLFSTEKGGTFETMPKWFRDEFVAGQGRYEAVKPTVPPNPKATEAQLDDILQRSKTTYCLSGDAVSHILVKTRAEADQIEAALAQGQDFATLARQSTDTGSRLQGGFLTCTGSPNWSQLPEAFRTAVEAQPVGTISAPIQTDLGFHVVKRSTYDLANLRAFAERTWDRSLRPPMTQFINNQLIKSKLWVDPRYGTVAQGPVRVQPPKAPEPKSKPPTSSTTAPAGASGS